MTLLSLLGFAISTIAIGQGYSTDIVAVSQPVIVKLQNGREAIEFRVTNNGAGTVTAWEVAVECLYSNGTLRTLSLTREGYEEYSGFGTGDTRAVLAPQGSVKGRILLGTGQGRAISFLRGSLRWAVFADNSVLGDRSRAAYAFEQREREYGAWTAVLGALEKARSAGSGGMALRAAAEALNAVDVRHREHPITRLMLRNIQLAIERHPSIRVSDDEFLRRWTLRAQQQVLAADAHRNHAADTRE